MTAPSRAAVDEAVERVVVCADSFHRLGYDLLAKANKP
jgi:hypothetical protein